MYIDSNRYTTRPTDDRIPQELAIYDKLEELSIHYVRVDHDRADTIEICHEVERVLGSQICKNLFLCNRQQTDFYLLMMPGDKPFKTKFLSAQLGCSRLSFADDGHMRDYLQTVPGSVSALELIFDTQHKVSLVIDRELLADEHVSVALRRKAERAVYKAVCDHRRRAGSEKPRGVVRLHRAHLLQGADQHGRVPPSVRAGSGVCGSGERPVPGH